MAKEVSLLHCPLAFGWINFEAIVLQALEDFGNGLEMLVVIVGEDANIVNVAFYI